MKFINREHLDTFLKNLEVLGSGSQGICYLDKNNKIVYKIFMDYYDEEEAMYTENDILKFSNVKNNTFIWPNDVIKVGNSIVGYTMPYKRSKSLYQVNPLLVNLDSLDKAFVNIEEDIKKLTDNGIRIYDLRYNTLYNNGKIYVIDTLDYSYRNVTYNENREAFDLELMFFLVDTYFDDFVNNDKLLKEMYMGFEVRGVDFLRVFRNKLSTYMGKDIKKLQSAKSLIKSNNSNSIYKREII